MNKIIYHLNFKHRNNFYRLNRRIFAYDKCFLLFLIFFVSLHIFDPGLLSHNVHADVIIDDTVKGTAAFYNGSSPTTVFVSDQTGYVFYIDSDGTCKYSKTTDGGSSWGTPVMVDSQTDCLHVAVWYDRWTPGDSSGTYIHILTIDSGDDDLFYTRLDTSNDTLTTTVNATGANQGGTFGTANIPSITRGTDGDLYMGVQDGSDSFVIKCTGSCDSADNWSEAGTNPFDLANDYLILMPLAGGNIMAIRWDISANAIQSKVFNNAASAWDAGWADIDTDATNNGTYAAAFGATVDKSTGDIYLVYAADIGTLGTDDDIRTAIYSGGSWTSKADVLTNHNEGITGAKIAFDETTGDIYVLYTARTTKGTAASANVYFKRSADRMVTWGTEEGPVNTGSNNLFGANVNIISGERIYAAWYHNGNNDIRGNTVADLPLTVQFSAASQSVSESVGSVAIPLQLSAVTGLDVTVPFTVTGTANSPGDYSITASPVTIAAGTTTAAITVTIVDDGIVESDETVIVTMGTPTNAIAGSATVHTITIIDNDEPPPPPPPFEFFVTQTTPDDGAVNVAVDTVVSATFNAFVNGSTVTTDTFKLSEGGSPVSGVVATEGSTITFTPSNNLAYNTAYTATITTGVAAANYVGTTMDSDYIWSFTTVPDTTAPTGSIVINSGSSHTNSNVVALTLSATDNAGVAGYFVSTDSATPSSSDSNWVSVDATTNFTKDISYTLSNGDGNKTVYAWYRDAVNNISDAATDSIILDTTAPVITNTSPADGATGVSPVISEITATFSEEMDTATVSKSTFTLSGGVTGTVEYSNTKAAFSPSDNLAHSTLYTATITKGVKDLAGNSMASGYSWSFTTSTDTTAPVGSVKINNDATYTNSPSVTLNLSATDATGVTGYFISEDHSAPLPSATGWVSVESTKNFSKDVSYTLKEGDGNKIIHVWYRDDAGNVSGAASDSIILDTTAPTVTGTDPADGAAGVPVGTKITATFSEGMDAATIDISSFTLSGDVTGVVEYTDTTATYTPSVDLGYSTTYTASITTAAKDVAGNALSSDYTWSFTTEPDTIAPAGTVVINNNDTYTNSTTVTLNLSATDNVGVTGYYASNSSSAPLSSDPDWVSVSSAASYTEDVLHSLSSGDGTKTVYVRYKDVEENISEEASDSIVLDMTSPVVSITSVSFGISSDDTLFTENISYTINNNNQDGKRLVHIEDIAEGIHGRINNVHETITITANMKGSAKDSLSGVNRVVWENDRGGSGTATGTVDWSISNILLSLEGDNIITVTAFDNANNSGAETVKVSFGEDTPGDVLDLSKEVAYLSGDTIVITVKDNDRNTNSAAEDILNTAIKISASYFIGNNLFLDLNENGVNSGTFLATIKTGTATSGGASATNRSNSGIIKTVQGGTATVTYSGVSPGTNTYTRTISFSSFDATLNFDVDTYLAGSYAVITLADAERNEDHTKTESLTEDVFIQTSLTNITKVRMVETGVDTGTFAGSVRIVESGGTLEYEYIQAAVGETLTVTYDDEINTTGYLRMVTDTASVAGLMPTPTITATPAPAACKAASVAVFPAESEIKKNESGEVIITVTGKDECVAEGVKVKAKVSQGDSKKIRVTPSKQKTDANGQAIFTIKAKKGSGKATVRFKAKGVKGKAEVTVYLTK